MTPRILIVEHRRALRATILRSVIEAGLDAEPAPDGVSGFAAAGRAPHPDLVVLDLALPDVDSRDVCLALRARGQFAPVLFLAGHGVPDPLAAFDAGGDDCLTTPFHPAELLARINALLRRLRPDGINPLGDAQLDPVAHTLILGEHATALTTIEFRLLAGLASAPGEAVRNPELVRTAWASGAIVQPNTLQVHIGRVRRKLAGLPNPPQIVTVRDIGYRLRPA